MRDEDAILICAILDDMDAGRSNFWLAAFCLCAGLLAGLSVPYIFGVVAMILRHCGGA